MSEPREWSCVYNGLTDIFEQVRVVPKADYDQLKAELESCKQSLKHDVDKIEGQYMAEITALKDENEKDYFVGLAYDQYLDKVWEKFQ